MWEKRSGCDEFAFHIALKSSSLMHRPPPPEQQHLPTGTLEGPCGMGPSISEVMRRTGRDCTRLICQLGLECWCSQCWRYVLTRALERCRDCPA